MKEFNVLAMNERERMTTMRVIGNDIITEEEMFDSSVIKEDGFL